MARTRAKIAVTTMLSAVADALPLGVVETGVGVVALLGVPVSVLLLVVDTGAVVDPLVGLLVVSVTFPGTVVGATVVLDFLAASVVVGSVVTVLGAVEGVLASVVVPALGVGAGDCSRFTAFLDIDLAV